MLQAADWRGNKILKRVDVEKGRPPNDRSLFINGLGGITSFMAREGITDPIEGPNAYLQAARHYHDNREHITGTDFFGYLNEKVKAKARGFNSFQVMPEETDIHPSDKAVSEKYRKLSDGE